MIFKLPSFKVLILFVTVILTGKYFAEYSYPYWELGLGLSCIVFSFVFHRLGKKRLFNTAMIFSLVLLLTGYYHIKQMKPSNHLSQKKEVFVAFYGKVISYPKTKLKRSRFVDCKKQALDISFQRQEYVIDVKEVQLKSGEIMAVTGKILVKSKSLGKKLVQQVETESFEGLVLNKLPSDRTRQDVLNCYKKDKQYYRLKHDLKADEVHKLYNAIGLLDDRGRFMYKGIEMGDWITVQSKARSIQKIKPCSRFDYKEYLSHMGINYTSYPYTNAWITISQKGQLTGMQKWAKNSREYFMEVYNRWLPDQERELIKGLILGAKEGISEETLENFQKTGISHILAVSGLHVALIGAFLFIFLELFGIPKRYVLLIICIILVFYVYMVGYKASILRAVIMFYSGAFVFVLDRDRNYLNALFLSAVIILFYHPMSLFTLGFQLSFLATLGILLYFKRFRDNLLKYLKYSELKEADSLFRWTTAFSWIGRQSISLLALTLSAQILIIPLLIYHFGGYSLISFVSNVLIVVLAQGAVALALLLILVSFSDYLLDVYSASLTVILKSLTTLSDFLSHLPFAFIAYRDLGEWVFWVYYPLLLTILHLKSILRWMGRIYMGYKRTMS